MPYVVGALGSKPASSKGGFGRNQRGGPAAREPKGTRHAVDVDSRRPACGTPQTLRVFDDLDWSPDGEWCPECEALVPFE